MCHKSYTSKINHIRKVLPEEERYFHEDAVPAVVSKEKWEQVQLLFESRKRHSVRSSSGKPSHRYAGLLKCADCGCSFVCKIRRWIGKPDRYEYNCNGYHRYGTEHCTAHRIDEDYLDELIYAELLSIKSEAMDNYQKIEADVKALLRQKDKTQNRVKRLNEQLMQRRNDQKDILLERIRDRDHAAVYDEMLQLCESDIAAIEAEIQSIQDYNATIKKRKAEMKDSVDLIERIIREGAVSDANLRLLVDRIEIGEQDGKLDIRIILNANFQKHKDRYDENGNLTEQVFIY